MLSPSKVTYIAAAVIQAGSRVKFVGDGTLGIVPAGVADPDIGTAELFSGSDTYAVGAPVQVALNNHPGTRTCLASGAITATSVVRKAANGAVSVGGGGSDYGVALEAAADGDFFECVRGADSNASPTTTLIVQGANSTGGPQNLAAAGVTSNSRILDVIDLTTPVVLDKTKFTAGAAQIVQAQSAGDLSAKKLQFRFN